MLLNFKSLEIFRSYLRCFTVTSGLRFKTKGAASKKSSKSLIFSLSKLSDEYATFDNKKRQNKEGIGLGLHICKNLID